jgi:hypothetical protein
MPENEIFHPIEYICPICGEKTNFGTHFCESEREPGAKQRFAGAKRRFAEATKRIAIALVGLVLIEAMLWDAIGAYSLYALAAAPLAVLAALAVRRSPLGKEGRPYRELLKMAGGDKETVERLLAREKLRRPGTSRSEALRDALESYRRDLR